MNKTKAFLITLFMGLVSQYVCAHSIEVANAQGVTIYYNWTNNQTELTVTFKGSYSNDYSNEYSGDIIIPSSVTYNENTYPVTGIVSAAFRDNATLTSIVIPNSIKSIGNGAFMYCPQLSSIVVAADNTVYDSRDNCNAIIETASNTLIFGCKTTVIPNTVAKINRVAFSGCSNLESVDIPASCTDIGEEAFYGCEELASVSFATTNLTKINQRTFYGCGITSIVIPENVTQIAKEAFEGCANLETVSLPSSLTEIYDEAFNGCAKLESVVFPQNLFRIRKYAFQDCTSLTFIQLPSKLWSIDSPFKGCSGITEVIVDANSSAANYVGNIGQCDGLQTVTIYSDKVGFFGCNNIQTIYSHVETPSSSRTLFSADIKQTATLYVPHEFSFKYKETSGWNEFANIVEAEYGNPYTTETVTTTAGGELEARITALETTRIKKLTIQGPLNAVDIAYLRSGGEKMLELLELDLTNVTLVPGDVAYASYSGKPDDGLLYSGYTYNYYISDNNYTVNPTSAYNKVYSVYNNRLGCLLRESTIASTLLKVTWPQSITAIGDNAFYQTKVKEVVVSQPVTSIGSQAFYKSALETLTADLSQLETCGGKAFVNTPYLSALEAENGVIYVGPVAYCMNGNIVGELVIKSGTVAIADNFRTTDVNLSGVTSVQLPQSLKTIGEKAFSSSGLACNLVLPEGLVSIGENAFGDCSITAVNIPSTLTTIGKYAFSSNQLSTLVIPHTVEHIGQNAFCYNQLTTLTYDVEDANPEHISTVDTGVFGGNTSLETLIIGTHVKKIPIDMFNGCTALKEIEIPSNVEEVGIYAFRDCSNIERLVLNQASVTGKIINSTSNTSVTEIVLGNTVKTIEEGAFKFFTALESVNIPSSVTSIGAYAFYGCTSLSSALTIPDGVTELPTEVFRNCTSLTSVTLPAQMTSIGHGCFNNCRLTAITIPEGLTEIAPYTFYYNQFESVEIPEGVTTIGEGAFRACLNLETVTLPSTLETIGEEAFVGNNMIEALTIPANVTLGTKAFYSSKHLTDLNLGEGVVVGNEAFENCYALGTLSIPANVQIREKGFYNCIALETVTIGASAIIGKEAFVNCPVETLTVGESVTIGQSAFEGCSISELQLSDNVMIGVSAFKSNTALESLHVPTNVQIRDNVFDGCTSLASLVFERNNKNLGSKTFTGCPITSIRLLDASEDTYDYLLQFNKGTIYAPFDNTTYENAVLTVPAGSKQIFTDSSLSKWSDFTNIQEEADTDISELDNTIYIESVEGYTGRQLTLSVKMKNTVEAEGFQFDLYLPDEVTFAKDTNNRPIASLSTARTTAAKTNSFSAALQTSGALRVVAASTNGSVISGNDGEVARVTVNISSELAEGDYSLILRDITVSANNASSCNVDMVKSTLTVTSAPYVLGDANGDGNVNVSDFTAVAHHILGNTPVVFSSGAADANQDGTINVADLTAVAHLILYGSIERPNNAREVVITEEEDTEEPD